MRRTLACLLAACAVGCAPFHSPDISGPPGDGGGPSGPGDPPPTGSKWEGVDVTGACGRTYLAWQLVDEVCGGTDDPHYTDAFHAPMFRDGALVGDRLYAVDGSTLWVLDAADPGAVAQRAVLTGLGEPIAIAADGSTVAIAAGAAGLVVLDASDADAPRVIADVPLAGPAVGVTIDAGLAYVAMGAAGVAVVDLTTTPPAFVHALKTPGFAANVAIHAGVGYVAACSSFAAIDLATGHLLGETWVPDASPHGVLVAPARAVAVIDDVAFVAAGRYGAVQIDVADPTQPKVVGNCRNADEAFYASGVREGAGKLYVAGGEWGVLPVKIDHPTSACPVLSVPPPPSDSSDQVCSSEPPWTVLPWEDLYAPPAPGKDPVQVLPTPGALYAFGDARRIGLRAIDVHDPADPGLAALGRFEEPQLAVGIAANQDLVLVFGPGGGLFEKDADTLLRRAGAPAHVTDAIAGELLDDGTVGIATAEPAFYIGHERFSLAGPIFPGGVARAANAFAIATADGAALLAPDGTRTRVDSKSVAALPEAILATATGLVVAAPEWLAAIAIGGGDPTPLLPHGAFDAAQILDTGLWKAGMPRRLLANSDLGVVELASLGTRARLVVHADALDAAEIPGAAYVGLATSGTRVFALAADRGRYRGQLSTFDVSQGAPRLVGAASFTGSAVGLAVDGDRLYVADAAEGIRVYDVGDEGQPSLLGVVALEVNP